MGRGLLVESHGRAVSLKGPTLMSVDTYSLFTDGGGRQNYHTRELFRKVMLIYRGRSRASSGRPGPAPGRPGALHSGRANPRPTGNSSTRHLQHVSVL